MSPLIRWRCLFLLVVTLVMVLTMPLLEVTGPWQSFILAIIMVTLIGIGGSLIADTRKWWITFGSLVGGALLFMVLERSLPQLSALRFLSITTTALVELFILLVILRYALFAPDVLPLDRVLGAISGYLVLGLFWGRIYVLALFFDPGAIVVSTTGEAVGNSDILYFSLVTLSTLGYGDIVAQSPYVRLLAALEAIAGVLYSAVLIASLVAELRLQGLSERR